VTKMPNKRVKKTLTLVRDESGVAAIVIAIILTALCGFVGLAVDIGHMVMVRAELQRTADSGALAGVAGLRPYNNQTPNWINGQSNAHAIINNAANKADNQQFSNTDSTVLYGYWLLRPPTGYVQTLPTVRPINSAYLPEPAIRVILSRNVILYLAPFVGVSSPRTVSATATAILPETYGVTGLPPIAVSNETVYNTIGGTTVIDVSEQNIKIQSNGGIAGWFNLNGGNSVGDVSNNVFTADTGNNGTSIYMSPGAKATLTDYITQGSQIIVPVIQDNFNQKQYYSIKGWAAFQIDPDGLGSNSIKGHFVNQYFNPNVSPDVQPDNTSQCVSGTPKIVGP
jgi:Flp pilus assembly protein TadG